jgi:hypothetical protein
MTEDLTGSALLLKKSCPGSTEYLEDVVHMALADMIIPDRLQLWQQQL